MAKFLTDPVWWFFLIWLPDFFKKTRGLDIKKSWVHLVTIYAIVTVLSIVGGWVTGYLTKRGWTVTRARKSGHVPLRAVVLPIYLTTTVGDWTAVLLIGLAGAAHQAWSANLFTTVSDMFPKRAVASVTGIGGMAGALGGMLFPTFTGKLLDVFKASGNVTAGYAILFSDLCVHLPDHVRDPPPARATVRAGGTEGGVAMDLQQLTKMYDFSGKTVVITGGAGVLGGEMACALVGCGASVAIMDRDPALADRLKVRLQSSVGKAMVVYGDVLKKETLVNAAAAVQKEFGPIDALINTAGGNNPKATAGPDQTFFDLPEEGIRLATDLNILGTILPSQVFGKLMASRKEGVILNISSMAAYRPLTRVVVYSAAKAAMQKAFAHRFA